VLLFDQMFLQDRAGYMTHRQYIAFSFFAEDGARAHVKDVYQWTRRRSLFVDLLHDNVIVPQPLKKKNYPVFKKLKILGLRCLRR
jgi:hypothetical protein